MKRHGHAAAGARRDPVYSVWSTMIQRCRNPNARDYPRYGGRGIRVCERWRRFEHFLADIGPRPSPKHSIDRINNDGHYEPGNCRWVERWEQNKNRRPSATPSGERNSNARLTWEDVRAIRTSGESRAAIARRFGISWNQVDRILLGKQWKEAA